MNKILFSVVIPVYNKEYSIIRSIKSVLNQILLPNEIIIIDDGSTDNTTNIIENYISNKKINIKLLKQDNKGVSITRNIGISVSKNKYIALLDADDAWLPIHLLNISYAIKRYPNAVMFSSRHKMVDVINNVEYVYNRISKDSIINIDNYFTVSRSFPIINSSKVVLNINEVKNKKIFPEGIKVGEDEFAWFSLARTGKTVAYCNDISVLVYRINDDSRYNRKGIISYLVQYASRYRESLSKDQIRYIWSLWMKQYYGAIMQGEKELAIKYLKHGFMINGIITILFIPLIFIPSSIALQLRNFYRN